MPRQNARKSAATSSAKHTGARHRFPGAPWRVSLPKGQTRDFLDVNCIVDPQGNLAVIRAKDERAIVVYAPGAWDSFELIVNVVSEPEGPTTE